MILDPETKKSLSCSYLQPAKLLLTASSNRNGNMTAATTILLCLIDRLSQLDEGVENQDSARFSRYFNKVFFTRDNIDKRYELCPSGELPEIAGEFVFALFRGPLVHNGKSLKNRFPSKNCVWEKKLGDWWDKCTQIEIVDRRDKIDSPVFGLDTLPDSKGDIELILDVGKITEKLENILKY